MQALPASFLEPLPQLLAHIFGSNARSASYEVLNYHTDYCVLSVQVEQPYGEIIVKLAGRSATMDAAFERTALIHNLIRIQTDVPVADIVAVDVRSATFPWRYLIQTRLPGTVWATLAPHLEPGQRQSAFRQIGHALAQMHSIRFTAFGEIASSKPIPSFVEALMQRAQRTIQHSHLYGRFVEVVRDRQALFAPVKHAVLCHDDLHHYNVLFDKHQGIWQLSGVPDFDKAWAGHFESDLARLDLWDNMRGDGFEAGYGITPVLLPDFEQRRLMYQLLWCLEYAVGSARHVADLQRVCQALDIAPIWL